MGYLQQRIQHKQGKLFAFLCSEHVILMNLQAKRIIYDWIIPDMSKQYILLFVVQNLSINLPFLTSGFTLLVGLLAQNNIV